MKKLNEIQKEMIKKNFGRLAHIIIANVEKYCKETETLQDAIDWAYDIMLQQAE
jgi:methylaspartate ammonia-lyase